MSDHIAHIGICNDVFRLACVHPAVHATFKAAMAGNLEAAHMGSITRSADHWSVDLIGWSRDEAAKAEPERSPRMMDKLAFTLGALTHRSADRLTKPITKCWPGKDSSASGLSEANESKIYQDVFVFREVFANGDSADAAGLFAPNLLGFADDKHGAEQLYRLLLRRALIAMHTLNPDKDDIHNWLDAFFAGMQQYPKSLEQYRQIHQHWPAAKVKKYLTDKRFYETTDPLIQLARAAQHGEAITSDDVTAAQRDVSTAHSRYARALGKSLDYLQAATDWFEGKIDRAAATQRFDIGVPELSLTE